MTTIKVSEHYGIVIRKGALQVKGITSSQLLTAMQTSQPFDEGEHLISFGPHFGQEACNVFVHALEALGLIYGDDFIDIEDTLPEWCQLYMGIRVKKAQD
jgi:hypothetical protein